MYRNLREQGINYVNLTINDVWKQNMVDINAYVAVYGDPIKVSIYFEPDLSLERETPTSEMIRLVAKVITNKYDQAKLRYRTLMLEDFIKSLACDIDPEVQSTRFFRTLNGLMRPKQLQKAIDMIINGDL